MPFSPYTGRKS